MTQEKKLLQLQKRSSLFDIIYKISKGSVTNIYVSFRWKMTEGASGRSARSVGRGLLVNDRLQR